MPLYRPRSEEREKVYFCAKLQHGSSALDIEVMDVSLHGFMGECSEPVACADEVRLVIPKVGSVPAIVKWAIGTRVGCRLADGASFADCIKWLASHRQVQSAGRR